MFKKGNKLGRLNKGMRKARNRKKRGKIITCPYCKITYEAKL